MIQLKGVNRSFCWQFILWLIEFLMSHLHMPDAYACASQTVRPLLWYIDRASLQLPPERPRVELVVRDGKSHPVESSSLSRSSSIRTSHEWDDRAHSQRDEIPKPPFDSLQRHPSATMAHPRQPLMVDARARFLKYPIDRNKMECRHAAPSPTIYEDEGRERHSWITYPHQRHKLEQLKRNKLKGRR